MKVIIIDCAHFVTKDAAHEYIAKALDFPTYYGKNLDALADCLSEVPKSVSVVIINAAIARAHIGGYVDGIIEAFSDTLGKKGRLSVL